MFNFFEIQNCYSSLQNTCNAHCYIGSVCVSYHGAKNNEAKTKQKLLSLFYIISPKCKFGIAHMSTESSHDKTIIFFLLFKNILDYFNIYLLIYDNKRQLRLTETAVVLFIFTTSFHSLTQCYYSLASFLDIIRSDNKSRDQNHSDSLITSSFRFYGNDAS